MWTVNGLVLLVLFALINALFVYFLGSYLKRKGENLATHEDLNKLVIQMSAVTAATKRIEADISSSVWDKQKRWEMKREVLFEATKRLAEIDEAMLGYATAWRLDRAKQMSWKTIPIQPGEELAWEESKRDKILRWSTAATAFDQSRLFVGIVCGPYGKQSFEDLGSFVNNLAAKISSDPDFYSAAQPELTKKILIARNAIRIELEVDGPVTQSENPPQ